MGGISKYFTLKIMSFEDQRLKAHKSHHFWWRRSRPVSAGFKRLCVEGSCNFKAGRALSRTASPSLYRSQSIWTGRDVRHHLVSPPILQMQELKTYEVVWFARHLTPSEWQRPAPNPGYLISVVSVHQAFIKYLCVTYTVLRPWCERGTGWVYSLCLREAQDLLVEKYTFSNTYKIR